MVQVIVFLMAATATLGIAAFWVAKSSVLCSALSLLSVYWAIHISSFFLNHIPGASYLLINLTPAITFLLTVLGTIMFVARLTVLKDVDLFEEKKQG